MVPPSLGEFPPTHHEQSFAVLGNGRTRQSLRIGLNAQKPIYARHVTGSHRPPAFWRRPFALLFFLIASSYNVIATLTGCSELVKVYPKVGVLSVVS